MKITGTNGVVVDVPEAIATGLIASGQAKAAPVSRTKKTDAPQGK